MKLKLPNTEYTSRPWRVHEFTDDFEVEDVWKLPTYGGPDDLVRLVRQMTDDDDSAIADSNIIVRTLWSFRWKLGALLGWDKPDKGLGKRVMSLRDRLPSDLREVRGPDMLVTPFTSVYQTHDEWLAEVANSTVHALMHLGWVQDEKGDYYAQMTALVKPNGLFGKLYMWGISPLRRRLVYPPLFRAISREWRMHQAG